MSAKEDPPRLAGSRRAAALGAGQVESDCLGDLGTGVTGLGDEAASALRRKRLGAGELRAEVTGRAVAAERLVPLGVDR